MEVDMRDMKSKKKEKKKRQMALFRLRRGGKRNVKEIRLDIDL
jgi:hypothetical protein